MPKNTTVVVSACWYREMPQSQCKAGPSTLSIVISMESAIQQRPTHSDNFTWNQPNPRAFTACVTVNVSVRKKVCSCFWCCCCWCICNCYWYICLPSGTTLTVADVNSKSRLFTWSDIGDDRVWLLRPSSVSVTGTFTPGISSYSLVVPGRRSPILMSILFDWLEQIVWKIWSGTFICYLFIYCLLLRLEIYMGTWASRHFLSWKKKQLSFKFIVRCGQIQLLILYINILLVIRLLSLIIIV